MVTPTKDILDYGKADDAGLRQIFKKISLVRLESLTCRPYSSLGPLIWP